MVKSEPGKTRQKTQKISEQEKETLRKLLFNRIIELKKCKQSLITQTKILINQIQDLFNKNLNRLNMFIDGWNDLLIKTEYNEEEIWRIGQINNIKIVAVNYSWFFDLKDIKNIYGMDPFSIRPVTKEDLDKQFKDFQMNNMSRISMILASRHRSHIVTGGIDGVVRIWDKKGNMEDIYGMHDTKITSLTLSADEQFIVSGSKCGTIALTDLKNKKITTVYNYHGKKIKKANISSNNQFIISACSETLYVCDNLNKIICGKFNTNNNIANIFQADNCEYFIIKNTYLHIMNFNCLSVDKAPWNVEFDEGQDFALTVSGKYILIVEEYECEFMVFKINAKVEGGMRKGNQTIGTKFKKSYLGKRLKLQNRIFVEKVLISDDFKYIAIFCDIEVFIWSVYWNL